MPGDQEKSRSGPAKRQERQATAWVASRRKENRQASKDAAAAAEASSRRYAIAEETKAICDRRRKT